MLIEPHYKLIFLSWLPQNWRTPYLKFSKKGTHYDCEPPSLRELEKLIQHSGFDYTNVSIEATSLFLEIERKNSFIHNLIKILPIKLLNLLKPIIPTLIYVLEVKNIYLILNKYFSKDSKLCCQFGIFISKIYLPFNCFNTDSANAR